jgi:hypothetical protein
LFQKNDFSFWSSITVDKYYFGGQHFVLERYRKEIYLAFNSTAKCTVQNTILHTMVRRESRRTSPGDIQRILFIIRIILIDSKNMSRICTIYCRRLSYSGLYMQLQIILELHRIVAFLSVDEAWNLPSRCLLRDYFTQGQQVKGLNLSWRCIARWYCTVFMVKGTKPETYPRDVHTAQRYFSRLIGLDLKINLLTIMYGAHLRFCASSRYILNKKFQLIRAWFSHLYYIVIVPI